LTGADVSGVDFSTVNLFGISSSGLTGTPQALPAKWAFVNGSFIGLGVNLHAANLRGADLRGVDLTKVNATGALLAGANLSNAILSGANFSRANLASDYMTGTVVTGTNFSGANLQGTHDMAKGATYSSTTHCSNGDLYGNGGDCPE
jgi:uncharacterized protein YjbI with pentapeptide repeats